MSLLTVYTALTTIFAFNVYHRSVMMTTPNTTSVRVKDSILFFLQSGSVTQLLKKTFETNGYHVTIVTTETDAIAAAKASLPALILIGRQLRTTMNLRSLPFLSRVPIVAVEDGPTPCLEEECDGDYDLGVDLVVCSQRPRELLARVRAILRRPEPRKDSSTYFRVGKIQMDLDRHEVTVSGRLVELTPKEFQILRHFLESPNQLFSRQEMLNKVWGEGYALEEHALDVHIHSLRQKIESQPAHPKMIVTVRGIGYKLRD